MTEREISQNKVLIDRLRNSLSDFLHELEGFRQSDWYLWKFLKEHRLNLKASADAIRSATNWKTQLKLNILEDEDKVDMMQRFPYSIDAVGKGGHPVLVVPFGRWRIREAIENGERDKFLRQAITMTEANQERLKYAIESSEGQVDGVIIIFDLKEYTIRQLMHRQTIQTLSEWTKRSEQLYPQQLSSFFVINANWVMPILFSLLKPFMSRNTVDRVKIFDSDDKQWRREILEIISIDQLPEEYSGIKVIEKS